MRIAIERLDDLIGRFLFARELRELPPHQAFAEKIVFVGLVTACRLAACADKALPALAKSDDRRGGRAPSEFSRTTGSPPSMTAMQEFVVPKSIPRILLIILCGKMG